MTKMTPIPKEKKIGRTAFRRGLTLVETLVAIGIFTMGLSGFSILFVRIWNSNSYTMEMGQSAMAVSQGVNRIVDYLRSARQADNGAYPIKSATENDLVVYSDYDRDGTTERLHFYRSGQDVLMGVRNPIGTMPKTYPSGDEQTIKIAGSIMNASDEPIFEYYDGSYVGDSGQPSLDIPVDVSQVRLVKILLRINIDPNRAPDNIEIRSFVELRNLNDYDRID